MDCKEDLQKQEPTCSSKSISVLSLNTTKAGMEGLDREKIDAIVNEASKGSKFYESKAKNQVNSTRNLVMA